MQSTRKNWVSVLLLLGMIAPFLIGSIWFRMERNRLHKTVEARISEEGQTERLKVFSFSVEEMSDLEWEDEREFRLDGEMYDVIQMECHKGKVLMLCFLDRDERALEDEHAKWVARLLGNHPHQKSQQEFVINWIKTLIPLEKQEWNGSEIIFPPLYVESDMLGITRYLSQPIFPPPQFS